MQGCIFFFTATRFCLIISDMLDFAPMSKENNSDMLTIGQAARELKASPSTIRLWAATGKFKGVKRVETPAGVFLFIPRSSLKDFFARKAGRPVGVKNRSVVVARAVKIATPKKKPAGKKKPSKKSD